MRTIQPDQLTTLRQSGGEYALFDVRESADAHRGHIFGATFLPRRTLTPRIRTLVPRRDTPVVVYDEGGSDQRALLAANTLERYGYSDVIVLAGGWQAWIAQGGDACEGSNLPSKWFGETVHEHAQVPSVSPTELHARLADGQPYRICDIRSPEEFQRNCIPGAHGVFGSDVAWVADDLAAGGQPVVVHCSGRTRSIIACQSLRLFGVPDVYALENGTMGWRLNGYALEKPAGLRLLSASAESRRSGRDKAMRLARVAGAGQVDADTLASWLQERDAGRMNLHVLDIRQVAEYVAGHVPGATALPGGLAVQRTDEFIAVRAAQIVLVDDDESRASLAAYWLRAMGLPHVSVLRDGLAGWSTTGRALSYGRDRAPLLDVAEAEALIEKLPARQIAEAPGDFRMWYVDTQTRFLQGRPERARWVGFGNIEQTLLRSAEDAAVRQDVLVAETEALALSAALAAYGAGIRNVRVLAGGVAGWRAEGFALESGPTEEVPCVQDVKVQPYDDGVAAMNEYLSWEEALTAKPFPSLPLYTDYRTFTQAHRHEEGMT